MRSLAFLVLLLVGVGGFSLLTSGSEIPSDWEDAWPRTDFSKREVPLNEIVSGGPPKDGIPPIDTPRFEPADRLDEPFLASTPVMSVEIGADARAYPLSILVWHEVVNDTVGGVPISVTYCPLCNSGVVFERTVAGSVTSFGTTGKLRNSDLIMYDRATESWWQQWEGRAIVGTLSGTRVKKLPVRLEALREFRARHPQGLVLVPEDPGFRPYGRNPYVGYDSAPMPFLFDGEYDGPGSPTMRVVAVEGYDEAWSLDFLREANKVSIGDLEITWHPGQVSALDAAEIARSRDVGTVSVQRRLPGGAVEDVVYSVPFAFAFLAFKPDARIWHSE